MKVREVMALVEADGWVLVRTRGDHRQYKHPTKPGLVTITGSRNRDVPAGTLANILRQAGLRRNP
jgi:predicted RNA binding protein YcfA (HicA-like mRNA interferase family)